MDEFSFLLASANSFSFFKRYASMVSLPTICSSSHIFSFSLRSSVSIADVPLNFPSRYCLFHFVIRPGYISFSLASSSMLSPLSALLPSQSWNPLYIFSSVYSLSFPLPTPLGILTCLNNMSNYRRSLQYYKLIKVRRPPCKSSRGDRGLEVVAYDGCSDIASPFSPRRKCPKEYDIKSYDCKAECSQAHQYSDYISPISASENDCPSQNRSSWYAYAKDKAD